MFVPGWNPDFRDQALETMKTEGVKLYRSGFRATPIPKAMSLSSKMIRYANQLSAGTCWVHGPIQAVETTGNRFGLDVFPICRRLVGWIGKQLEGDDGNPSDGGSGYDAFMAMTRRFGGVAHESLCPYTDNETILGKKPPKKAFEDAKDHWLDTIVRVENLDDAKQWIARGHAVAIGSWWPTDWQEPDAIKRYVGDGEYGHERCLVGYAEAGVFDRHEYFEEINSWGLVYDPLPTDLAAKVPGYKSWTPDKSAGFWVQRECEEEITEGKGNAEFSTMTNLDNFKPLGEEVFEIMGAY